MTSKTLTLVAVAFASIFTNLFATASPAEASYACWYRATNGTNWTMEKMATGRNTDVACRRAKRRCNRALNRAKRRNDFGRGTVTPSCFKAGTRNI